MSLTRPIVSDVDARILPGLICWYRAETLREHFGDGANVTYIFDESGNGCNLSSAAANKPPAYVSDGCNGYASLSFDGSNSEELRGNASLGAVVTGAFAVVKNSASGNWGTDNAGMIGGLAAGNVCLAGDANAQTISSPASIPSNEWVNGTDTNTVTNTDAWNLVYIEVSADTVEEIVMGRYLSIAAYFSGEIAECGMFTGSPTAAQRTAFFDAMIAKYAITGS